MASKSVDDLACQKLNNLMNGPVKKLLNKHFPNCSNSNGDLDIKVIDKKYHKPELTSLTFELMQLLTALHDDMRLIDSFKKDIKEIHKNHEENVNELLQKFTLKIASEAKNELTNQISEAKDELTSLLSLTKQPNEKPKIMKKHIPNEKQVLVVNIDEHVIKIKLDIETSAISCGEVKIIKSVVSKELADKEN